MKTTHDSGVLAPAPAPARPLLAGRIAEIARGTCTQYAQAERVRYGFKEMDLLEFAWAIERECTPGVAPAPEDQCPNCNPDRFCTRKECNADGVKAAPASQPHDWREGLGYWQCKRCGIVSQSGQENACTGTDGGKQG